MNQGLFVLGDVQQQQARAPGVCRAPKLAAPVLQPWRRCHEWRRFRQQCPLETIRILR